jgi:hypothetical protein
MTIRRADGRLQVEEIAGDAWSGTIDLSGQFQPPRIIDRVMPMVILGLLLVPLVVRLAAGRFGLRLSTTEDTEDTQFTSYRVEA